MTPFEHTMYVLGIAYTTLMLIGIVFGMCVSLREWWDDLRKARAAREALWAQNDALMRKWSGK